jgi:hypothetical protein
MALQYVGGKALEVSPNLSPTAISLSGLSGGLASSPAAGDFVLVVYALGGNADVAIGIETAGYTEVEELYEAGSTYDTNMSVSYKFMGGTPDTSVSVSGTGTTTRAGVVAIHVWRGVHTDTPIDSEGSPAGGSGTSRANPPAVIPLTSGAVVIGIGGGGNSGGVVYTSGDLSNFVTAFGNSTADTMVGVGSIAWTSGAVDPAQFGGGSLGSSGSWVAHTIALRPAPTSIAYSITADGSSYSLSGANAVFQRAHRMAGDAGSYALTGQAANLRRGYSLVAAAGAYALTGTSAGLRKALRIAAAAGSYALTGVSAILRRVYRLTAEAGSYLLTGEPAELAANLRTFNTDPVEPERSYRLPPLGRVYALRSDGPRTYRLPAGQDRSILIPPLRRTLS